MIDPVFMNINRLFVLSFKNGGNDPMRIFDRYYMPLVLITDFNALIDNIPFSDQPSQNKQAYKNILKCQEIIIMQQEICQITLIIKIIINSFGIDSSRQGTLSISQQIIHMPTLSTPTSGRQGEKMEICLSRLPENSFASTITAKNVP